MAFESRDKLLFSTLLGYLQGTLSILQYYSEGKEGGGGEGEVLILISGKPKLTSYDYPSYTVFY